MASSPIWQPMVADNMRVTLKVLMVAAAGLIPVAAAAQAEGDAVVGEHVFKKCKACHEVGQDARKRSGPPLNNIINARAAQVADFRYSKAMEKAGDDGLHWTVADLDAFLTDPTDFVPKTKMRFKGLKSGKDRANVIAFLATFSGDQMAARKDEEFVVAPEVLAIEGDVDYGEYLSSECTTCHQTDGEDDGIPAIVGWDTDPFVVAMHAYRAKHRDHPVMSMIAGRLSDEEIAGLAAYFANLGE